MTSGSRPRKPKGRQSSTNRTSAFYWGIVIVVLALSARFLNNAVRGLPKAKLNREVFSPVTAAVNELRQAADPERTQDQHL